MQGTILGDIVASRFTEAPDTVDFDLFTVDCRPTAITVLTVAIADTMLRGDDYTAGIEEYVNRYLDGQFPTVPPAAYVTPVGWLCNDLEQCKREARRVAAAIETDAAASREAVGVAVTVFLARQPGADPEALSRHPDTPNGDRHPAFRAFLHGPDLLGTIRLAACTEEPIDVHTAIAGGMAGAYYGPAPAPVQEVMNAFLPGEFQDVLRRFEEVLQVG